MWRQPIGDVNKLKEFGSRMDELFRENFADLNRTSRTIRDTFKKNTWAEERPRSSVGSSFCYSF